MSSSLLAIQLGEQYAVAVSARLSGDAPRIERAIALAWPEGVSPLENPQAAGAALGECLEKAGVMQTAAIALLPREAVTLKYLELPAVGDQELAQLVQFQAEGRSPLPLDELCLDYLPLPVQEGDSMRRVVLAMVRKTVAAAYGEVLQAAGLSAVSLGLSSSATMEILARGEGWPGEGAALAVMRRGSHVETLCVVDGHLAHANTVSVAETEGEGEQGSAVLAAIARTLMAPSDGLAGRDVSIIGLVGDPAEETPLAKLLEQETSCQVLVIDPLAGCQIATGEIGVPRSWLVGPIGALWAAQESRHAQINFMAPRRPAVVKSRVAVKAVLAAALVLCLGAYAGLALHWRSDELDRELRSLAAQEKSLRALLDRGKPTSATVAAVDEWSAGQVNPLDQMAALSEQMPAADRAYLAVIQLEAGAGGKPGRMTASGYARQPDDVTDLNVRLMQHPERYKPQPHGIQSTPKDKFYEFRFDLESLLNQAAADAANDKAKE